MQIKFEWVAALVVSVATCCSPAFASEKSPKIAPTVVTDPNCPPHCIGDPDDYQNVYSTSWRRLWQIILDSEDRATPYEATTPSAAEKKEDAISPP